MRDTERLDWLEESIEILNIEHSQEGWYIQKMIRVPGTYKYQWQSVTKSHETLREAIDEAMEAEE